MQSGVSFAGLFSRILTGYATIFSRGYGHRVRLEQRMFGLEASGASTPEAGPLEPVPLLRPRLGGKEGAAAPVAGMESSGLPVDEVE
jgi:hypothetical protein